MTCDKPLTKDQITRKYNKLTPAQKVLAHLPQLSSVHGYFDCLTHEDCKNLRAIVVSEYRGEVRLQCGVKQPKTLLTIQDNTDFLKTRSHQSMQTLVDEVVIALIMQYGCDQLVKEIINYAGINRCIVDDFVSEK